MKKRMIALALAAALAVPLAPTPASAFFFNFPSFGNGYGNGYGYKPKFKHFKKFKHYKHVKKTPAPKETTTGGDNGLNGWQAYVAFSTWCSAGSLIVGAAIVGSQEQRELTSREAWRLFGNCFIPFVGGPLFEAISHGNVQQN